MNQTSEVLLIVMEVVLTLLCVALTKNYIPIDKDGIGYRVIAIGASGLWIVNGMILAIRFATDTFGRG
jgi:hypothetical protein